MRASFALAFAAGAFAVPQYSSVLIPITQISDGQIQAPTAVPSAPVYSSAPVVVTSAAPVSSAPVSGAPVSSAPVVAPSVSAPVVVPSAGNSSVVVPVSSAPSYPNSTVVLSTTAGAGASSAAPSASAPAGTGAAAANMVVSFGGVAAAVLAFLA